MDEILTRKEAARFLRSQFGLRTTAASLATMASRGGGPRFIPIGRYRNYLKRDLMEWACQQCSGFLDSTSTPPNNSAAALFLYEEDLGDLTAFDYRKTGDPYFDEITRLEEAGVLQAQIDAAGEKYRRVFENT
jgi:hypothetical protein